MNIGADNISKLIEWLEIDEQSEGQRVDNFLINHLKGVPKSLIYRILRRGEVRVNKGRVKPDYRLHSGDRVRVPPLRRPETVPVSLPGKRLIERIQQSVLYEDAGLMVINKPAGVAVHGGSGVNHGIIEALRIARPEMPGLELVHRLDRETSGCLMIAKKRSTLRALHALLREEHGVDKRYVALVKDQWRGGDRKVTAALKKNVLSSGERVVRVEDDGKASTTVFRPLRKYSMATLVEAAPLTGRTHQIRVHAAHIGHPIAGDEKYGDEAFNVAMRNLSLRRLFLHAASLRFILPGMDQALEIHAPLDEDLERALAVLTNATGKD